MLLAKNIRNVEIPEKARNNLITFVSPILSPKGPPTSEPAPYMKDTTVPTVPITKFETPKSFMIMIKRGGAITNNEWLSECAAPSIASNRTFLFSPVN